MTNLRQYRARSVVDLLWQSIVVSMSVALPCLGQPSPKGFSPPPGMMRAPFPWIDTHVHLDGKGLGGVVDYEGAARVALQEMDNVGIRKAIILPPPQPPGHQAMYEYDACVAALKKFPGRFALVGGGGSLNAMIQQVRDQSSVSDSVRRQFEAKAEAILAAGAAGFGEMTALHFSHFTGHPFEVVAPDHPLFRLLADIAARHDVVIDLHMEAVVKDMALPAKLVSPPNPRTLQANIPAFGRLLAHNPKAKIVWVHAGSDQTGQWTVALSRELLQKHPNLHMSIRTFPPGDEANAPIMRGRGLTPQWLELIKAFPDRFVIGTDAFYKSPKVQLPGKRPPTSMSTMGPRMLLNFLPADLARKVGYENATRLYKLKE